MRRTVTITRVVDIQVDVEGRRAVSPGWWEPGEPEEWWINGATDDSGDTIELTEAEKNEAVTKAADELEQGDDNHPGDDEPDPDPLDEHKPL